jgi:hypothetical protein
MENVMVRCRNCGAEWTLSKPVGNETLIFKCIKCGEMTVGAKKE